MSETVEILENNYNFLKYNYKITRINDKWTDISLNYGQIKNDLSTLSIVDINLNVDPSENISNLEIILTFDCCSNEFVSLIKDNDKISLYRLRVFYDILKKNQIFGYSLNIYKDGNVLINPQGYYENCCLGHNCNIRCTKVVHEPNSVHKMYFETSNSKVLERIYF